MSKNSSLEDTAVGYNDAKCREIDAGPGTETPG